MRRMRGNWVASCQPGTEPNHVQIEPPLWQHAAPPTPPAGPHLVGLRHIGKHHVHHGHQHAVLLRVPRILNDGDHVGPLLGHVHQVTAAAGWGGVGWEPSVSDGRWAQAGMVA